MNTPEKTVFAFKIPEPSAAPVSLPALLDELVSVIQAHVILPLEAAQALAVWVVHTYVFSKRDAVAYVAIESPEKRCGKTTLLSVLAGLASKSLVASNISVGALFRVIAEAAPTLFIDEADTFLGGNSVMRGILNCGNTWRTAYVVRLAAKAKKEDSALAQYCCWCPKVIAMIGKVPDTIADRSILIPMERKLITDTCCPLSEFKPASLTSQCVRWANDNRDAVGIAPRERIAGLNDRAADTFEPLAVLARLADSRWQEQFTKAALFLSAGKGKDVTGAGLLLDMLTIFVNSGRDRHLSRDIVNTLRGGENWLPSEFFAGRRLTEMALSLALRPYGITPITVRDGTRVGKGYKVEDFRRALLHYVPRSDVEDRLKEINQAGVLRQEAEGVKAEQYKAKVAEKLAISAENAEAYILAKKDQLAELKSL